jgi:hypothetical protein
MKQSEHKKLSREEKREIRRKAAKVMGDKLKYYASIKSKDPEENEDIIKEEKE